MQVTDYMQFDLKSLLSGCKSSAGVGQRAIHNQKISPKKSLLRHLSATRG
jgi:hypothetical protein